MSKLILALVFLFSFTGCVSSHWKTDATSCTSVKNQMISQATKEQLVQDKFDQDITDSVGNGPSVDKKVVKDFRLSSCRLFASMNIDLVICKVDYTFQNTKQKGWAILRRVVDGIELGDWMLVELFPRARGN